MVQKSLRFTQFRKLAEIAYQITDMSLDLLPFIQNTPVESLDPFVEDS
jgi:hypothetical protein